MTTGADDRTPGRTPGTPGTGPDARPYLPQVGAQTDDVVPGLVTAVETLSGRTGPVGERVHAHRRDDARAWISYHDGSADTDITGSVADLALLGWIETDARDAEAENAALGVETVTPAHVHLHGTWTLHAIDPHSEAHRLPEQTVLDWLSAAVASLITSGVAHEATSDLEHDDLEHDDPEHR